MIELSLMDQIEHLYLLMATTPYHYRRGEGKQTKYQVLLHAREEVPKLSHVLMSRLLKS